jgi:hypothetical protein
MLSQSLWVLHENWLILIEAVVLVSGLGGLIFFGLRRLETFQDHLPIAEAVSGGISLVILICFGVVVLSHFLPAFFRYFVGLLFAIAAFSTLALTIRLFPLIKKLVISKTSLFIFLVFLAVLITRFSFLYHLNFPPYLDSPVHFQIIQDLRNPAAPPLAQFTIGKLFTLHYYHFGFHSFVAVLSAFGNIQDALQAMLIVGQLMVLISTFSLAFFAKEFTGSSWAGVFTALFAGIGWRMPLYAVNWGKYPAIAGIAIFPLALAWLAVLVTGDGRKGSAWFMAGIGCVASLLLHSRMLLLLLAALITFALIKLLSHYLNRKLGVIVVILIEIALMITLIHRSPDLTYAVTIYGTGTDLIITCIAVFLSVFAVYHDPKRSLAILTFSMLVFIFCLTPLPGSLKNYLDSNMLLDRPMVELIIFAPLAILAGMGLVALEGLRRFLPGWLKNHGTMLGSLLFLIFLILPVYFHMKNGDYRPDACCDLVTNDDISAVVWISAHLPADSRILISVQEVDNQVVSTDAGIWITPLTGIRTVQESRTTDFSSGPIYSGLCRDQVGYIFLGSKDGSFNASVLETNGAWYSSLLNLPTASLYQINCPIH